jgi:hypothetical protein
MPGDFYREDFSPELHLSKVQDFYCGDLPWEMEVADWIKCVNPNDCAIEAIREFGTRVWVYFGDADARAPFLSQLGRIVSRPKFMQII